MYVKSESGIYAKSSLHAKFTGKAAPCYNSIVLVIDKSKADLLYVSVCIASTVSLKN